MNFPIEDLEKNISFEDNRDYISDVISTQEDTVINYTNLVNLRAKKKELVNARNLTIREEDQSKVNDNKKSTMYFNRINSEQYSFYLSDEKFSDIIFYHKEKINFVKDLLDFRNYIYDFYTKTNTTIVLHFYPYISEDWFFSDIGFFDGIFKILTSTKIDLHAHLSNPYIGLVELYLACSHANKINVYENTSSIKINLRSYASFSGDIRESILCFYREKLKVIEKTGILTKDEINRLLDKDDNIVVVDNKTLIERVNKQK
jgi:hypothetical protein